MSNAFTKYDTNEWTVTVNGKDVALTRERPTRMAAGARRGMVEDRSAPWEYSVSVDFGAPQDIDATDLKSAKAQALGMVA